MGGEAGEIACDPRGMTGIGPTSQRPQLPDDAAGSELRSFANGLRQDEAAVRAALELPWSSGQTEGQITRLKLIKRQMFGRAKHDLLRARVLQAA